MEKTLGLFSWALLAVAASAALYTMFAHWAVRAESFGTHDMGWALFFALSGAWALVACLWLVPVAIVMATVVTVAKLGSSRIYVMAAAFGALPFLLLR